MSVSGTVEKKWLQQKGCGFIKGDDGEDYFTHKDSLVGGVRLQDGGRVQFDVDRNSRPNAKKFRTAINVSGPAVIESAQGKRVGTVIEWYPARKYGFILPANSNEKVYVHASAFDGASLQMDKAVFFDIADVDHKSGRKVAINVSGGAVRPRGDTRCIVKRWIPEKGYGFVEIVATGEIVFVHFSSIGEGAWLEEGGDVYCNIFIEEQKGGKKTAINVTGPAIHDESRKNPWANGATYDFVTNRHPPEKRIDYDGNLYSKSEFIQHYGGLKEWESRERRISPANGQPYTRGKFIKYYTGVEEWDKAKKYYEPYTPDGEDPFAGRGGGSGGGGGGGRRGGRGRGGQ